MNNVVVIPARGGSKGIKGKNIRNLCSQPLISYTILDALRMKDIDEVYVSTDSEEIMEISKKYGAEVPFKRPEQYARDNSLDIEWINHFLSWFKVTYDALPRNIVHLRATTPIRDVSILDNALTTFQMNSNATSLRSVELFAESPYKWVKIDENGYFEPLLGDDKEAHTKPRQGYPNVYRPNGYIDIYKTETILGGSLCGDKVLAYIVPYSPEIDNEETFKLAEVMMNI